MKKIIFLCLLAFSLNASDSIKNDIFIGGSLGVGEVVTILDGKKDSNASYYAFSWGVRGGYQVMFFKYIGLRTYLDYMMSIKPSGLDTIASSLLSFNLDFLANFLVIKDYSFGFFGGVGYGYFQHANVVRTTPEDEAFVNSSGWVLNFGLSLGFEEVHRVDLGAKIPFERARFIPNPEVSYKDSYIAFTYAYLF